MFLSNVECRDLTPFFSGDPVAEYLLRNAMNINSKISLMDFIPRKSHLASFLGSLLVAVFPNKVSADAVPAVAVDAIYWQGWGVDNIHQNNLQDPAWHDRHPFYTEAVGDGYKIEVDSQEKMDREIQAAADIIRAFAFMWDNQSSVPNYALDLYLRSAYKDLINFYVILPSGYGAGYDPEGYSAWVDALIDLMAQPSYQKMVYGYPLLHIRLAPGMTPDDMEGDRLALEHIVRRSVERSFQPPYVVVQGSEAEEADGYRQYVNGQALSSYAAIYEPGLGTESVEVPFSDLARINRRFWEDAVSRGLKLVPPVSAGWDPRPRGTEGPYYTNPSPEQIANHVADAIAFSRQNPGAVEASGILIHAWNETDQGAWLHPTLQNGSARLDALRSAVGPAAILKNLQINEGVSGAVNLTVRTLGMVDRVSYYVDGERVGEAIAPPYDFAWDTRGVTDGPHVITAEAHGPLGNSTLSESITVVVANGLRIMRDLSYGPDLRHKFDMIEPLQTEPPQTKRPAIVLIHGGGWIGGDKSEAFQEAVNLVSGLNMVCFTINYRLFAGAVNRSPTQISDVQRAMRFIRLNSDRFNVDPDHIGVGGSSAGGHLAALVTTRETCEDSDPALRGIPCQANAAVPLMGIYDLMAGMPNFDPFVETYIGCSRESCPISWQEASAITFINDRTPPFLMFHGANDSDIPVDQARRMHQALTNAGRLSELIEFPRAHDLFFVGNDIVQPAREFFIRHLTNAGPAAGISEPQNGAVLTSLPITIAGTSEDDVAVAYRRVSANGVTLLEENMEGNSPISNKWSLKWSPEANGDYTIEIYVRDRANASDTKTIQVTVGVPPAAPENMSLINPSARTLLARWSAAFRALNYRLTVATDDAFTSTSILPDYNDRPVGQATETLISGLRPDTRYFARLRSVNGDVFSAPSATAQNQTLVERTNQPPRITAGPTATLNPALTEQAINFIVTATDPDGDALAYAWTFGDGGTGAGAAVVHTYAAARTYQVRVTVSDGRGGTDSKTVDVVVNAPLAPPGRSAEDTGPKVIPNPATSQTDAVVIVGLPDNARVRIIRLPAGETVSEFAASRSYTIFDLSIFKTGLHLIQINGGKTVKFVVIR